MRRWKCEPLCHCDEDEEPDERVLPSRQGPVAEHALCSERRRERHEPLEQVDESRGPDRQDEAQEGGRQPRKAVDEEEREAAAVRSEALARSPSVVMDRASCVTTGTARPVTADLPDATRRQDARGTHCIGESRTVESATGYPASGVRRNVIPDACLLRFRSSGGHRAHGEHARPAPRGRQWPLMDSFAGARDQRDPGLAR